MNAESQNRSEWENPENWARPRWLGLYFSPKDSRTWVPKYPKALGWTVNLAQPKGAAAFLSVVICVALVAAFALSRAVA